MGRNKKQCPPIEEMYDKVSSLLVPDYILKDFDITMFTGKYPVV